MPRSHHENEREFLLTLDPFFSLGALNTAIGELLVELNQKPMQQLRASRKELFERLDRPALQPLPSNRYEPAHWKIFRANIDYHVDVERHLYSVPYQLRGEGLEAAIPAPSSRFTSRTGAWRPIAAAMTISLRRCPSTCPVPIGPMPNGPRRISSNSSTFDLLHTGPSVPIQNERNSLPGSLVRGGPNKSSEIT